MPTLSHFPPSSHCSSPTWVVLHSLPLPIASFSYNQDQTMSNHHTFQKTLQQTFHTQHYRIGLSPNLFPMPWKFLQQSMAPPEVALNKSCFISQNPPPPIVYPPIKTVFFSTMSSHCCRLLWFYTLLIDWLPCLPFLFFLTAFPCHSAPPITIGFEVSKHANC